MFNRNNQSAVATGLVEFSLWGQRWPSLEVAGESHYSGQIGALFASPLPESGTEAEFTAHLLPEPNNRYDRNAVQVVIEGNLVGYLPKDEAARYQSRLMALRETGFVATVGARVWARPEVEFDIDRRGNTVRRRTGRVYARVTLALAAPHLILPLNTAPGGVELPSGRTQKLTQTASTAEACAPWLQPEGEGWVHMTLHRVEEVLARSTRELVEGRIDGVPAGRLTPAMSQNYLPLIDQLADRGLVCVARAIVKGNRVKTEVSLHAAKASEVLSTWLEEHVYSVPIRAAQPPSAAESPADASHVSVPGSSERSAGWYDDPEGMAPFRYWDGTSWTARIKMR